MGAPPSPALDRALDFISKIKHIKFISSPCRPGECSEDTARYLLFELVRAVGLEPRIAYREEKGPGHVEETYDAYFGEVPVARITMDKLTVQDGELATIRAEVTEVEIRRSE